MGTIGGNVCLDTRCTYYNQTWFWRSALGFCLKKDGDVCHVTKVGKKCVAAHSADTAPVLMTLGAVVDLVSAVGGERSVPVEEFFVADGVENTVRGWNEIVARIRIPLPPPGLRTAFRKVRQRGSIDFPLLNVAVAAELDADRVVVAMRMVVSALGSRPRVISGLEGREWPRTGRCLHRRHRAACLPAVPSPHEHHRRSGVAPCDGAGLRAPRAPRDRRGRPGRDRPLTGPADDRLGSLPRLLEVTGHGRGYAAGCVSAACSASLAARSSPY
jgi:hypothetical protein